MAVASGTITCGTSPTKVCTAGEGGVVLFASATGVFVGGPNEGTSGATAGIQLAATTPTFFPGARTLPSPIVPAGADLTCDVYVISTAGTQTVSFYAPQGG